VADLVLASLEADGDSARLAILEPLPFRPAHWVNQGPAWAVKIFYAPCAF
jgi:hypothetical protein